MTTINYISVDSYNSDLYSYVVQKPYISNQPGQDPDGNPILYMGIALAIKRQFFALQEADSMLVNDTYHDAKKENGLLNRSRFKLTDPESYDDYVGIAHSGYFAFKPVALDIYQYGLMHDFFYANVPLKFPSSLRYCQWRFPGLIAHYKMAATIRLNLIDRILWSANIAFGSSGESGLILDWLMVDLYRKQPQKSFLMDLAMSRFIYKLSNNPKYPNKMGDVFGIYFGKSHIFSKWMQGIVFNN